MTRTATATGTERDSQVACTQPAGYVSDNTDCNDTDINEHPGQTWYKDSDDDGLFGRHDERGVLHAFPRATEDIFRADGLERRLRRRRCRCDPWSTWYHDTDGDGYGDGADSQVACTQPAGYVSDNTDCNDTDINEHPGQTWYKDSDDDDGYSDGTTNAASCTRPAGYKISSELTALSGDCATTAMPV